MYRSSVVIEPITQADIEIACSLHKPPGFKSLRKKGVMGAGRLAASMYPFFSE
jgi:hypothetical protein